jgi:hypothetical protein
MGPVASATSLTKSRRSIKGLGNLPSSSPPAEKSTTSEDQTRKTSTGNWARHRNASVSNGFHHSEFRAGTAVRRRIASTGPAAI